MVNDVFHENAFIRKGVMIERTGICFEIFHPVMWQTRVSLLLKLVKTTSDSIIHPLGQVKDSPELTVVEFLKQIAVC